MRKICITIVSCICLALSFHKLNAQSFIDFSQYQGNTSTDYARKIQVVNGETYVCSNSNSSNTYVIIVTKYSNNGAIIYSTAFANNASFGVSGMKIIDGEVFLIGWDFFSIDVSKLNVDGSIAFVRRLHGTGQMDPISNYQDIQVVNNEIYLAGTHEGNSYPVTMGPVPQNWNLYGFLTKISAIDGSIIMSMFTGGSDYNFTSTMTVDNDAVYITGISGATDLPITIGNYPTDGLTHTFVRKINCNNFSTVYCRYIGEASSSRPGALKVENGQVHLAGYCYSANYPVTNGSIPSISTTDISDGVYTRLNTDGSIGFSTYLSTDDNDQLSWLDISNGEVFLTGISLNPVNNLDYHLIIFKLNSNGTFGYTKKISYIQNSSGPYSRVPVFKLLNGELYFAGRDAGPDFTTTNGTAYCDPNGFFAHLSSSGDFVFATFLGKMNTLQPMQFANNKFYLLGSTDAAGNYPVTNNSVIAGGADNVLIVLNPDGTNFLSGYIGGSSDDTPADMAIDNNDIYFIGNTSSNNFPVTSNSLYQGYGDIFLTKLSFCPNSYYLANDTLLPKTQTVCKYGLAQIIHGNEMMVPGDSLPTIYLNGTASLQHPIVTKKYQWQIAYSITGPWTDIPGAVFKDYRPVIGAADQYYRRVSFTPAECGTSFIHFSDTAVALVNTHTAPTVNAGGTFVTCPGSTITIGGTPTVTGGTPPYASFVWDMGAAAVANPAVSPYYNTIYTLAVTDALGCSQLSQAVALVYESDAGFDKSNCAGTAVRIGSSPVTGVPGILYNWQPTAGLTSTTIAQPFANPATQTDYSLMLTVPKSGGGTCITKDTVRVTPVSAPVTPDFAGADKVICLTDSTSLGTVPEAGFNYAWSPATYLISNNLSVATYYPGIYNMPVPNPATIILTAEKAGCYFTDDVVVATIESNAGYDDCGPRIIGSPDRTPTINETYSWAKISGPGNFTGATNLPQVPVSASAGASTIYGLTVSYNGGGCYDEVVVPAACSDTGINGCMSEIRVDAKYHCPAYSANNGVVTLVASSNISNAVFSWTPLAGLSGYTGHTVQLTDNVQRTYAVTARDINDSTIYCVGYITVNDPAFVVPVFDAPDTATCGNTSIMIGLPPVTGYTYEWIGYGLSDNTISSPVATMSIYSRQYPVNVANGTGCEVDDTVNIIVQNSPVNAGADWMICSNAVVQLGTTAQYNSTYLWQPQAAPWQNGTNQFSAQPEVLVASGVTYTVTATSSAGCVSTDYVTITVNNSPIIPDAPDKIICAHFTGTTIGSPALSGAVYQWVPSAGLNNDAIAQPMANPASTTTYTVFVTFPGLCSLPATDLVTVTVIDLSSSPSEIHFCPSDGAITLGTNGPTNLSNYQWFPNQLVTNAHIANPTTLTPPPNTTTTFTVYAYNAQGCQYRDTITIIPAINAANAGNDRTVCKDQPTLIGSIANTSGPFISYNWSPATFLDNPSNITPVFTGSTAGTFQYVLTKTDNNALCTSVDTVNLTVEDILPVLTSPTVCRNSCVRIGTTPVAGLQYQWTPTAGLSDPNSSNPLACIGTSSSTYTLTVIDPTGCIASESMVIGVNNLPGFLVSVPVVNACLGDTGTTFIPSFSSESGGTYSYLWSPDNGTLSDVNVATPTVFITGTGNSQYLLQVTDNTTGCTNTVPANLAVNICQTLATAGNYMWFDTNTNGIQEAGELGVSGIAVKLYNNAGFNVANALTDANGLYYFSNIPPGNDYYVIFNKPTGYSFTTQNVGGITAINNSKADPNGRSNNFNLAIGGDIRNIDAGIKPSGTVPVSLLSFTAALHNREVLLNWQTTAEYNNDYFNVERSNDAINFTPIGQVDGNGTSSLPHNYSLIDPNPVTGMNYYRLKQVDLDGYFTYSHIERIQLNNDDIASVYYNGATNMIQFIFNKPQDALRLKLYASNGQLVKSASTTNNTTTFSLELPALATGIYTLQVVNEKFVYTKKLFITK